MAEHSFHRACSLKTGQNISISCAIEKVKGSYYLALIVNVVIREVEALFDKKYTLKSACVSFDEVY